MRLFRGLGGQRHAKQVREDDSIGSEISTKDQFDIIVPLKHSAQGTWTSAFLERDTSTVSSITTADHDIRFFQSNTAPNSSWCCCAPMNSDQTKATVNTLLSRTIEARNDSWCCAQEAEGAKAARENPNTLSSRSVDHSLNRTNSLFDILSEEEDEIHKSSSMGGMKRLRKNLRRKMPWPRKLTKREMEYMQAEQVQI